MFENRNFGISLIVFGVLSNNYVYLHDIIVGTFGGWILLGWLATIGIVLTLAEIGLGLFVLLRSQRNTVGK